MRAHPAVVAVVLLGSALTGCGSSTAATDPPAAEVVVESTGPVPMPEPFGTGLDDQLAALQCPQGQRAGSMDIDYGSESVGQNSPEEALLTALNGPSDQVAEVKITAVFKEGGVEVSGFDHDGHLVVIGFADNRGVGNTWLSGSYSDCT